MMTKTDLENLVACYIHVEGYTDLRSIYNVMVQEYQGNQPFKSLIINKTIKEERN